MATNLVRFPSTGTATYTASSEFSPTYAAPKAADGSYAPDGNEWATAGSGGAAIWWRVTWSDAQILNAVWLYDRPNGSDWFGSGSGTLRFSDGSTVAFSGLPNNGSLLEVTFADKSGITWLQVETSGSTGSNPGLSEVEAFLVTGGNVRLTQDGLEVVEVPSAVTGRATQTGIEVVNSPTGIPGRVTQFGTEVVEFPNILARVTQFGVEVVYEIVQATSYNSCYIVVDQTLCLIAAPLVSQMKVKADLTAIVAIPVTQVLEAKNIQIGRAHV